MISFDSRRTSSRTTSTSRLQRAKTRQCKPSSRLLYRCLSVAVLPASFLVRDLFDATCAGEIPTP
jgi:hypothetical protein